MKQFFLVQFKTRELALAEPSSWSFTRLLFARYIEPADCPSTSQHGVAGLFFGSNCESVSSGWWKPHAGFFQDFPLSGGSWCAKNEAQLKTSDSGLSTAYPSSVNSKFYGSFLWEQRRTAFFRNHDIKLSSDTSKQCSQSQKLSSSQALQNSQRPELLQLA